MKPLKPPHLHNKILQLNSDLLILFCQLIAHLDSKIFYSLRSSGNIHTCRIIAITSPFHECKSRKICMKLKQSVIKILGYNYCWRDMLPWHTLLESLYCTVLLSSLTL